MEALDYIKEELLKIKNYDTWEKQVYAMNGIYALLEQRGYERSEIKKAVDCIIVNNLKNKTKELDKLVGELKNVT